jgi:hypothetical protein
MSAEVLVSREAIPSFYPPAVNPLQNESLSENQELYGDTPFFAAILDEHQGAGVAIPYPRPSSENVAPTEQVLDFDTAIREETPLFTEILKPFIDIRAKDIATLGAMAKAQAEVSEAQKVWVDRLLTDVDYTAHTPKDYVHARAPRPQLLSRTSIWNIEVPDHPTSPQEDIIEKWPVHAKGFGLTIRPLDAPTIVRSKVPPFLSLRTMGKKIATRWHKLFSTQPKRLPL